MMISTFPWTKLDNDLAKEGIPTWFHPLNDAACAVKLFPTQLLLEPKAAKQTTSCSSSSFLSYKPFLFILLNRSLLICPGIPGSYYINHNKVERLRVIIILTSLEHNIRLGL
jgi:hypothetical protein